MKKQRIYIAFIGLVLLFSVGCASNKTIGSTNATDSRVVQVGYYGGICEAPVYIAYENGIFKKNGLTVKLVKVTPATMKKNIVSGKLDAVTITQDSFKTIEQGLPLKLTNGFHTSFIQAVVPVDSSIKSVADLKGRTIGVDNIGGPPMVYLSMELSKLGINPKTDVNWRVYPSLQLHRAMEKKEIDAFSAWEPFPQIAVDQGKARVFFRNIDFSFSGNQICCYVGISSKVIKDEPEIAKLLTKSFAEATEWVGAHPQEAAQISIDKKYTWGDVMLITTMLAQYQWVADPVIAKQSYTNYLNVMKELQFLDTSTDVATLINYSFVDVKNY